MKINYLDTNIILLDANNIAELASEVDAIGLSEIVIKECDKFKGEFNERGFQARQLGRMLQLASIISTNNDITELLTIEGIRILIVSKKTYSTPRDEISYNDKCIVEGAELLRTRQHDVTFITNDTMARIYATTLALPTRDFKQVDNYSFEFTKHLSVPEEVFSELHYKPILQIDPLYQPENYNYLFSCPSTDQIKPAIILEGTIHILGKTTEDELRRQDAAPINVDQLLLSRVIQEPSIDLVITDSRAGSGKTICAVSNAMKLVKKSPDYNSILYIRTSIDDVSDEESVGFLSGNDEKFAVYLHPINDVVDTIVRNRHKDSKLKGQEFDVMIKDHTERIFKEYNIQAMTTLGMRGRTFTNCIAIIDEVQNFTPASLNKVLTRFGKNCKVILIGSLRQIDSKYITKYTSGLSVILNDSARDVQRPINLHVVPLHKVVRSKLTEYSEALFTKS